ncbi:hypothetical protein CYY_006931 [Polysphondylium violaceum]|uniref:Pentacotripeptide-repeat region of PRORP domain-containing protein n=1 Tax=Polysphondylium violaceum TaxID=133409 RepID=A0A8J4UR78_9MYCE|nr:hypothetical protein CYY_006931 [Polysphondylium violaceum]
MLKNKIISLGSIQKSNYLLSLIHSSSISYTTSTNQENSNNDNNSSNNNNNSLKPKFSSRYEIRDKLNKKAPRYDRKNDNKISFKTPATEKVKEKETAPIKKLITSVIKKEPYNNQHLMKRAPEDRSLSQKDYFEKLAQNGKFHEAKEVLKYMGEDRKSLYGYEKLLMACSKAGLFTQSWKTYNEMKKHSLKPSIYTLSHMINVCCNSLNATPSSIQERIEKIMSEIEKFDVKITVPFFNVMMKTLIRIGKYEEAIAFPNKMTSVGAKPDLATYTTWISAKAELFKSVSQYDENKRDLFNTLRFSYDSQELDEIRARGIKQIEEYLVVIQHLKKNNVLPDRRFINSLLSACRQTYHPAGVFEVWDKIQEMRFTQIINPDTKTYDILVSTANNINNIDKGIELINEIIAKTIRPDIDLINNLYRVALRASSLKKASQREKYNIQGIIDNVIEYMARFNLLPNQESFSILISAYAKLGKMNRVYELFIEMKELGLEPTIKDYNGVIKGLGSDIEKILDVFDVVVSKKLDLTPEFIQMVQTLVKRHGKGNHVERLSNGLRYLDSQKNKL